MTIWSDLERFQPRPVIVRSNDLLAMAVWVGTGGETSCCHSARKENYPRGDIYMTFQRWQIVSHLWHFLSISSRADDLKSRKAQMNINIPCHSPDDRFFQSTTCICEATASLPSEGSLARWSIDVVPNQYPSARKS